MNILVQVFRWTYAHISFGNIPKSEIAWVPQGISIFKSVDVPLYQSTWVSLHSHSFSCSSTLCIVSTLILAILANWWFEFSFPWWLMKLRTASGQLLEKQTEMEISKQKVGGRTHWERAKAARLASLGNWLLRTPQAARGWQDPLELSCLETRRPDLLSSTDQSLNVGCPRGAVWLGVKSSLLPKAVPREGHSWERLSKKLRDRAL